jgi:hypothetical protein
MYNLYRLSVSLESRLSGRVTFFWSVIGVNAYSSVGAVLLRIWGGPGSNICLKAVLWMEILQAVFCAIEGNNWVAFEKAMAIFLHKFSIVI